MGRRRAFATALIALAAAGAGCSTSQDDFAGEEPTTAGATSTPSPTPAAESTASATSETPVEPTLEPTPEPEVRFEHGEGSRRAQLRLPSGNLERGIAAVVEVTGYRTYRVEIPAALAADHIRCKVLGADNQNDRLSFQVSTQPGLLDDNHLDEDEYSLDDDELLFTTQTWSEGTYRRVFTSVYTSADGDRLYIDENQNGMQIDNPHFRYSLSEDRKVLRLSIGALVIDDITWETGKVTLNAVVHCR